MITTYKKFFNGLNKLDNYWILREEEKEAIVGTNIIVKVHTEIINTFSTYFKNVDTLFPVFFLLTSFNKPEGLRKEFVKRRLPIKIIDKELLKGKIEIVKEILDEFVEESFKS